MNWETLATWMALAFTLALSILVPLFTQIANNRHQRKMQREQREFDAQEKKRIVYTEFLLKVGSSVTHSSHESLREAGAALYQLYAYAPHEWWNDMDQLSEYLRDYNWGKAAPILQKLSRLIAEELDKER